ncbi:hypothetical protein [Stella sp.]|uniref:hypothetical protein n=1 Tax=Stella sp. TaxID=2912054 RepID=UPI0035AF10E6
MQRILLASAAACIVMLGVAHDAAAWQRSKSVTTWRGTYSAQGSGSCAYGACQRSYTATGPYGRSVSRHGSISRDADSVDYSRTTTGPYGRSVTRSGSISRY